MDDQELSDLEARLEELGYRRGGGEKPYPDGAVEVQVRRVLDTSGPGERTFVGMGVKDAIRKAIEQLEAEREAG